MPRRPSRWSRAVVVTGLVGAACTRSAPAPDAVVLPPAPPPSAPPSTSAVAAPPSAPRATADLAVLGGELVDLGSVTSLHALGVKLSFATAVGPDTAYVCERGASLDAYDVTTGASRWSKPLAPCHFLAATARGAIASDGAGAQFFDAKTGAATPIGTKSPISGIVAAGGRFLVLHTDKKLEAFDDAGTLVGTTVVPVIPDGTFFARNPFSVAGALACGAQRSDVATEIFCVDASPRVVWRKTLAVPGGMVRQASPGALVVASDTWAKSVVSEVLRPSDGATLLHLPSVRLAAALTAPGGALDAAFAGEPHVTCFDPSGSARWTWSGGGDEALQAVRVGPNVALALYNPIATGTQLVGLDVATGTLAWTGNVDGFMIAHSKYSNVVELRLDGSGRLLLVGREAMQEFAQLFDPKTGTRTGSFKRRR